MVKPCQTGIPFYFIHTLSIIIVITNLGTLNNWKKYVHIYFIACYLPKIAAHNNEPV